MGEDRSWRVALVPNTLYLAAKIRSASHHGTLAVIIGHGLFERRLRLFKGRDVRHACFAARPAVAPYQPSAIQ